MLKTRILLLPVKVSVTSCRTQPPIHPCPRARILRSTWVVSAFKSQVRESLPIPKSCWEFFLRKYHRLVQESRLSSGRFLISCIFGLSLVTGSVSIWPQIGYCTNDFEFEYGDHFKGMLDGHDEDRRVLLSFIRKLLVPIFLIATVLINWGHPFVIAAKVALILFTTKPSPLSVYLYVEELRQQSVWQLPFIYLRKKSYSAEEVEVEDYMFLCLARVNLKGKKSALIGILGNWWVLPLSSWQEAPSMSRRSGFPFTPVPFFNCI